jgi:hypothetical protein
MYVVLTRLLTQLNLICTTACNTLDSEKARFGELFYVFDSIESHTLFQRNSCKLVAMFLVSQACEIYDQTELRARDPS